MSASFDHLSHSSALAQACAAAALSLIIVSRIRPGWVISSAAQIIPNRDEYSKGRCFLTCQRISDTANVTRQQRGQGVEVKKSHFQRFDSIGVQFAPEEMSRSSPPLAPGRSLS